MVPNENWSSESWLRLVAGLILCLMVGGVLNGLIAGSEWLWLRFLVGTTTFHGAALVLVHWLLREQGSGWREAFGLDRGRLSAVMGLGALVALMVLPMAWLGSYGSAELMRYFWFEPEPQAAVTTLRSSTQWWQGWSMGFMAVMVAPVAEEVLFRGLMYPSLKRRLGIGRAALISSVLFALIHWNPPTFLPLLMLAGVLVWLYEHTGNLLAPVVAHAVFNLANLLLLWLV